VSEYPVVITPVIITTLLSILLSQNGVHYHFTTKSEFELGIADGKFLEYAYVHDNIYGTSIKAVQDVAAQGKCCILDIDVQGARQVRASGLRAIFVFISPPSVEELERRLRGRGTESEEQITTRLKNAREELASLEESGLYDYVIVNNVLETCLKDLQSIAARALAGDIGAQPVPESARSGSTARNEPLSATASLRGWLGEGGSNPEEAYGSGGNISVPPGLGLGLGLGGLGSAYTMSDPLSRWKGSVALVTGATGAVGRSISLSLSSRGLRVVSVSRNKKDLEALQQTVSDAGVPLTEFLPIVCDLTKEAEVVALPRIVSKRWPGSGIDILINAATAGRNLGADAPSSRQPHNNNTNTSGNSSSKITNASGTEINSFSSLMAGSTSAWVETVSTNILGTALVTREVVQDMSRRAQWGHIVSVTCKPEASGGGMRAVAFGAVRSMSQGLRQEARDLGVPLRVSCVSTGAVEPGVEGGPGHLAASDVAAAVAWCVSAPAHADVSEIVVNTMPAVPAALLEA